MPGAGELETLLSEMKADNRRAAAVIGGAQKSTSAGESAGRRLGLHGVPSGPREGVAQQDGHLWLRIGRILLESAGSGGVGQNGLLSDRTKMVTGSAALHQRLDHPGRARVGLADVATIILVLEALGVQMKWAKYRGWFRSVLGGL